MGGVNGLGSLKRGISGGGAHRQALGWPWVAGLLGLGGQRGDTAARARGACRRTDRSKQHFSNPNVAAAPKGSFGADALVAEASGGCRFLWKRDPSKTTRMAGPRRAPGCLAGAAPGPSSRPLPIRRYVPVIARPRFVHPVITQTIDIILATLSMFEYQSETTLAVSWTV